jgi:hypothetical protein
VRDWLTTRRVMREAKKMDNPGVRIPSRAEQYDSLGRALESMISRLATGQVQDLREAELLCRSVEAYLHLRDLEEEIRSRRIKLRKSGDKGR